MIRELYRSTFDRSMIGKLTLSPCDWFPRLFLRGRWICKWNKRTFIVEGELLEMWTQISNHDLIDVVSYSEG